MNKKDTSDIQWMMGKKFYVIKVEKGETLYSISKRFNVTQEQLILNNPELKEGLKVKMKLLIPSERLAPAPLPKEKSEEKKPVKKLYNISLMLPLKLWKATLADSVNTDSTAATIEKNGNETTSQIQFYEGLEYALDTFSSKDCKFHLTTYDTENDVSKINKLLKEATLKESDYIIASGNPDILKELSRFSNEHHIELLTYSLNASDALKSNPNAYAFTPSSALQCLETGKFFASKYKNANAIVIKSSIAKENERSQAFANGWNIEAEQKAKTVDYSGENFKLVLNSLVKARNNIVFIPSSNEDFVNSLVTKLNDTSNVYQFTVVGIPTWQYFESMDPKVMENLNTHFFSASGIDFEAQKIVAFRKFFRNTYMTEPEESAFQGYDAITFISNRCKSQTKKTEEKSFDGLFSSYDFISENGTNENHKIHILKYKDYGLTEVK